jgi:hypothetical protein
MTDAEKVAAIKQVLQDYVEGRIDTPLDVIRAIREVVVK